MIGFRKNIIFPILIITGLISLTGCSLKRSGEFQPVRGVVAVQGAVVAGHPEATRIGVEILKKGGNAFDAAVAVHFALAVAYPGAGNIGGGGFAVYREKNGAAGTLDFREKAPAGSTRDMYLDARGNVIPRLSLDGHLAVGVPGSVDGLDKLYGKYGVLNWKKLVQPAIDLAKNGVTLTPREARKLNGLRNEFLRFNRRRPHVVKTEGLWQAGDRLVHRDLAKTLERIRDHGRAGFYSGRTAELIVKEMQRGGGLVTAEDLEDYSAVWRQPLIGRYKSFRIIAMPPPSSGGVGLIQMLSSIEPFPVQTWGFNQMQTVHLMTEIERRVYADRAIYLADPDFWPVPVQSLLEERYLRNRMQGIDLNLKSDSRNVRAGIPIIDESPETTHFSIVDGQGNAVAVTTTLNGSFGSKVLVEGAGFFLNNEMDDFSSKPGVPNQFGLIGSKANAIHPGKRMLSSMTPTIVEKDGRLFMVLGSPGGATIITSVFQTFLNVVEHSMTMQEAVNAKRFHHQWLPDKIFFEDGAFLPEVREELEKMGHVLEEKDSIGKVNAILILPDGFLEAAADHGRGDDMAGGF